MKLRYDPTLHDDEGWNCEYPAVVDHYFVDGVSLCGKYTRTLGRFWDKELIGEFFPGGSGYCKTCNRALKKRLGFILPDEDPVDFLVRKQVLAVLEESEFDEQKTYTISEKFEETLKTTLEEVPDLMERESFPGILFMLAYTEFVGEATEPEMRAATMTLLAYWKACKNERLEEWAMRLRIR